MTSSYHIGAHSYPAEKLQPGLYLVPTPIGNLGDITLRGLNALAAADVVYCEDTRVTPRLLERFGIKAKLKAYHDHNSDEVGPVILAAIAAGQVIALVTDAGTPLLSDPGFPLVRDCVAQGLRVEALPGASALLPALQLSGLPTDRFSFLGFLPQRKNERLKVLAEIDQRTETIAVYEAPHRILDALDDMALVLGERDVSVSREISKLHEESLRGTAAHIATLLRAKPVIKGEFVIIIGPLQRPPAILSTEELDAEITSALLDHPSGKAASLLAKKLSLPRDDIYARILTLKGKA